MFDLKKLKDNNAIFWTFRFDAIREVAAGCGWAIGVHGSVVHDLDLMAMPWVENHTSADELAERLSRTVVSEEYYREPLKSRPGEKPNGRIVYTIFAGNTYIDLNVISPEVPSLAGGTGDVTDGGTVPGQDGCRLRRIEARDFLRCRNMRRILNQLRAHGIGTYGELARLSAADVMKWRNFGRNCFAELQEVMRVWNVRFRDEEPDDAC